MLVGLFAYRSVGAFTSGFVPALVGQRFCWFINRHCMARSLGMAFWRRICLIHCLIKGACSQTGFLHFSSGLKGVTFCVLKLAGYPKEAAGSTRVA